MIIFGLEPTYHSVSIPMGKNMSELEEAKRCDLPRQQDSLLYGR
jgi:hypothetical protein